MDTLKSFLIVSFSIPLLLLADKPVDIVKTDAAASQENVLESKPVTVESYETSGSISSSQGVEEVVVTAQKREQKLQETPIAITALTASTIDDLDIKNVVDMAGIAPNVMLVEAPSNNTSATIAMRGGVTINPAITWEPTVGVYLDGVYLGKTQGALFDVVDLERVEILRGPQGTLYGRNTLGGAINLISKKPNGSGISTKATIGNYSYKQIQFAADYEIKNNLYSKLVLNKKTRGGFVSNNESPYGIAQGVVGALPAQRDELDTIDSRGYRFTLGYYGDESSFELALDRTDQNNIPPFAQLGNTIPNWSDALGVGYMQLAPGFFGYLWPAERFASKGRATTASINEMTFEKSEVSGVAATFSRDLNIGTLKAIVSQRITDWSDNLDLDGSPFPVANTSRFTKYQADSVELQLVGSRGDMNYVFGYYELDEEAYTSNPQNFFGGGVAITQNYSGNGLSKALYGQIEFPLSQNWDLTLGLRSTDEDKDGFKEYVGILSATGKGSFDDTTSTFILSRSLGENSNVYFKLADGFKAGGFNAESSNPFAASTPYAPETVESMEIGWKGVYMDNRLLINAAYFANEHDDMQVSYFTADAAAASEVINSGADVNGFELETVHYINDDLKVMLNWGYLDPEFTGNTSASDGFTIEQFPYAPNHSVYLAVEKNYGDFRVRLDHSRISEHAIFPYNGQDPRAALTRVDSRNVTDFRMFFDSSENVGITLWIKNLTDKDYIVNNIPFGPAFGQLTLDYYGAPRTVGIDINYKF
jgi:iron complex outermembrane receptor protein